MTCPSATLLRDVGRLRPALQWALICVTLALSATIGVSPSGGQAAEGERPPEVLSIRYEMLERSEYDKLAHAWESYVQANRKDARAWVEWGDALRYAGKFAVAQEKYARALELDPEDPAVVSAAVCNDATAEAGEAWKAAHQRLLRTAQAHPDFPGIYHSLWVTAMRGGDRELTEKCLRRLWELGDFSRPLKEFAYNLIEGLPENAILLTNGDNDTYPPLAYQVVTSRRPDVEVVNLSLLNTTWYIRHCREEGVPITWDDREIAALEVQGEDLISYQVQRHVAENLAQEGWPRPLFYAVTVPDPAKVIPRKRSFEGLHERVLPQKSTGDDESYDFDRIRGLLDTVYRLEAATDPLHDWSRESAISQLTMNYVALLSKTGFHLIESGEPGEAGPYLHRAVAILAFHECGEVAQGLLGSWEKADPKARLLPEAKKLLES